MKIKDVQHKFEIYQMYDGTFACVAFINGKCSGEVLMDYTHEQLLAWIRLMTGEYGSTYREDEREAS